MENYSTFTEKKDTKSTDTSQKLCKTDNFDTTVFTNPTYNIAIIGTMNSGKSTFIHSLFGEAYCDTKINSSMQIPVYYETDRNLVKSSEHGDLIRRLNFELHKKLAGKVITEYDDIGYKVPPIPDLFDGTVLTKLEHRVYDIPAVNGLNKDKVCKYIVNNYYKFDLVIFVIDINTGLRTVDEIEILKLIRTCNIHTMKLYSKKVDVMLLLNKCDNLIVENKKLKISDGMFESYETAVKIAREIDVFGYVAMHSSLISYIYRTTKYCINKTKPLDYLDESYVDRVGQDNFGRFPWQTICRTRDLETKKSMIKPFILLNDSEMLHSGYGTLKLIIHKHFVKNILPLIYSKINFYRRGSDISVILGFFKKLDYIFGTNYGDKNFPIFLDKFLKRLNERATAELARMSFDEEPKGIEIPVIHATEVTEEVLKEICETEDTDETKIDDAQVEIVQGE